MLEERIKSWLEGPYDLKTKAEIKRLLKEKPEALSDAFFKDLSFGTGGLRAVMGIGTNRLNVYTIRMATQGLANYLNKTSSSKKSVFIGYDVRNHSREFAEEAAKVLSGNGIKALLSKEICPTPLVSFGCRYFGCMAAIMITASHNPPEYNGYKVYWNDGCQIVPPHDKAIIEEVSKIKGPDQVLLKDEYEKIGDELDEAYLLELKKLQLLPELEKEDLKIVYSNLHGTGIRMIPKALKSWGYNNISLVEKQLPLDGNFTNAPSPNPEEKKAMEMGSIQLEKEHGDIFIATDPDADRIGLVANNTRFTGNQIACLCLDHICQTLTKQKKLPKKAAFIKSIVTTELFKAITESYNATCIDVLTGFKYIGEKIGTWEKSHEHEFIFGAEESYGFLMGSFVRDKDAISSACLISEMAATCKANKTTVLDKLHEIYKKHGVYREALENIAFSDTQKGMDEMKHLMKALRDHPPQEINGSKVTKTDDFKMGLNNLPPSDVLRFWLEDKTKLVIRPSGTEPKIKLYVEVMQKTNENVLDAIQKCDEKLKKLTSAFKAQIKKNFTT